VDIAFEIGQPYISVSALWALGIPLPWKLLDAIHRSFEETGKLDICDQCKMQCDWDDGVHRAVTMLARIHDSQAMQPPSSDLKNSVLGSTACFHLSHLRRLMSPMGRFDYFFVLCDRWFVRLGLCGEDYRHNALLNHFRQWSGIKSDCYSCWTTVGV
jgi:hypothetical protein